MAIARGGFEFQGQKCSAASRVYVPASLWPDVRDRVVAMMREMQMGDVADFRTFMGAVIDRKAFDAHQRLPRRRAAQRHDPPGRRVRTTSTATSSSRRWSRRSDPAYRLMCEEIFGPVVTAYVYPDGRGARR